MAGAVQRVGKGNNAAASGVTFGSGDAWVTPTAGNLLVVSGNGDFTSTAPTGAGTWTAGPSIIDGNGAYTWYKIATGTESTVTVSLTSGTFDFTATICEYSGASGGFDAQNSSTISGVQGSSTTSTGVTTTAAGDLVVAFALVHAGGTGTPTSPSWTGGFSQALAASTGTTRDQATYTFVGELLSAGAAGSYATSCSWTATMGDRQAIVLAFKASAGATAKPVADAASAVETLSVAVTSALTDNAAGAETPAAAAAASLADSGAAAQALTAGVSAALGDAAAGADSMSNGLGTSKAIGETAASTEALTVAMAITLADLAGGAEVLTVAAAASLLDVAAAAEALTVAAAAALADAAAATQTIALAAAAALADAGSAVQALAATATLGLADVGAAADAGAGADGSIASKQLADSGAASDRLRVRTVRPSSGTTTRPSGGITARPNSGITPRP